MTSVGMIVIPDGDISRIAAHRSHSVPNADIRSRVSESSQDLIRHYVCLTPEQVAQVLQHDVSTVYRKLRSGQIPGRKPFGKWLTPTSELIAFIATKEGESGEAFSPAGLIGRPTPKRGRLETILAEEDES